MSETGEILLETHLLDYMGNLYGETAKTSFLVYLRSERRFDSPEILKEQIERDIFQAERFFDL